MRSWIFPLTGILLSSITIGAPLQNFINPASLENVLENILVEMNKVMGKDAFYANLQQRSRRRLFEPLRPMNRNATIIARCYFNPISC